MDMNNPLVFLVVFGVGGVLGEKLVSWLQVTYPMLMK